MDIRRIRLGEVSREDAMLLKKAREVIIANYVNGFHTVGSAVRCKSGNIYVGISIEVNQGCCAEVIAIGSALTKGEKELDCIVAIDIDGRVLNPCGKCRQLIFDCSPDCNVIVEDNNQVCRMNINKLLPLAFNQKRINLKRLKEQIKNRKE